MLYLASVTVVVYTHFSVFTLVHHTPSTYFHEFRIELNKREKQILPRAAAAHLADLFDRLEADQQHDRVDPMAVQTTQQTHVHVQDTVPVLRGVGGGGGSVTVPDS